MAMMEDRDRIISCLRKGLGSEDILARHGIPIEATRAVVARLRELGILELTIEPEPAPVRP